jgi:hypothetical protein
MVLEKIMSPRWTRAFRVPIWAGGWSGAAKTRRKPVLPSAEPPRAVVGFPHVAGPSTAYPQLGQRPALERRGRALQRQGQTHYQKGLWFSDISRAGRRFVSCTWRPTRAEVHPQIFLRRQKIRTANRLPIQVSKVVTTANIPHCRNGEP